MIYSIYVRAILAISCFGIWIALHYLFDKKSAEGLMLYVTLALLALGIYLDRYLSKRSKKKEQETSI